MAASSTPELQRRTINEEFFRLLWKIMAQLAIALKDILLQSASDQGSKALPPVQTRQAACTHMTMTRLYGPYRCSHCSAIPRFGWVYRCTQDYEAKGSSARLDWRRSRLFNTDPVVGDSKDPSTVQLSSWMEEAILHHHYTPEQSTKLREQKQKVIDSIATAERGLTQQRRASYPRTPPRPTVNTDDMPFPVIEEMPEEFMSLPPFPPVNKPVIKTKLAPECFHQTCPACRPLSRDRAWQSFDHILKDIDASSTIDFAKDNRPISRADLVRQLGLRKTRSRFRRFSDIDLVSNNENRQPPCQDDPSAPVETKRVRSKFYVGDDAPDRRGFRESARRAFHGMFMSRRRRSCASNTSNSSSRSSRKARRQQELWEEESDLGLQMNQSPEFLLIQAAMTRLPGLDGMDGLETEEEAGIEEVADEGGAVVVPDGVAVTEEAVDLGAADIIMAV